MLAPAETFVKQDTLGLDRLMFLAPTPPPLHLIPQKIKIMGCFPSTARSNDDLHTVCATVATTEKDCQQVPDERHYEEVLRESEVYKRLEKKEQAAAADEEKMRQVRKSYARHPGYAARVL
ncbi:hypothetical protein CLAFUW4_07676 [Fulvia fulva]|uniref:Uncharacterized protein n=1 Tax=Passalora fulva TaxID=5499 RepID=A0A9Q8P729_PASFU|nr:uncharacterized protein CLAFUR5_07805 [Fulvia fulva]KAK4629283.1 hypothetical protein CLAFUR4_07681 [Fulvia fulva]KAK4630634.1 hypothetical protein CLAFUR0_07681 [Fulvia fulva]UJO15628.1 hypothetical protein CLAFUR5_07805 [Fulvia fulva]WPV12330.1 hypothetical protein CLAFUW4_07676 [Fulvia fulva]WPV27494.1 hypothetical protein CLAFUW7_07677 [Fulvia fulva]